MDSEEFSADEARRHFARLLGAVEHAGTHVTVTKYGKPVAVIVPAEWHEQAKATLAVPGFQVIDQGIELGRAQQPDLPRPDPEHGRERA